MAIKMIQTNEPDPVRVLVPNLAGGGSTDLASQIPINMADYSENVLYADGIPDCRPGQSQTHTSYGSGGINGKWVLYKPDGTTVDLEAWGANLYTVVNTVTTAIYTALTNALARAADFNSAKYIMNGTDFIKYDGTTASPVTTGAYVPTLAQGRSPNGSTSTPKEKLNYLSNSWIDSFSADGTTVYQLSFTDIASVDVVKVNGVTKTVTVDYTVDLSLGKVTFVSGPGAGTNNVTIQATKANLMDPTKITKCKYIFAYSSRLWATGNPDAPSTVYNTGLTGNYSQDGSYWPENAWAIVGGDDANTGFARHLNELLLFKERSIEAGSFGSDGLMSWNKNISPNIGCDMPDTIQMFSDLVAFCNTVNGPMVVVSTVVQGQRNVRPIGYHCNGSTYKAGLLNEQVSDLKLASSCNDGRRYWVCVGSKAWVWDYYITPYSGDQKKLAWFYQTNINARCWLVKDKDTYFGDRTNGKVQKLTPGVFNDNGAAINKVLRTAELCPDKLKRWFKNVPRMWLTLRKGTNSEVNIKYIDDKKQSTASVTALYTNGFDWDNWDWDNFTWDVDNTNKTLLLKTPSKNTTSFQIEFSNNEINQTLPIVSLELELELTREI